MAQQSLVEATVGALLDRVLAGEFTHEEPLPPEGELADQLGVSRLTLREAVSVLRSHGILRVQRGRGTYLNYYVEWVVTRPVIQAISRADSRAQVRLNLLQIRQMIERGAIESFAKTRTQEHVDQMEKLFQKMNTAHENVDVAAFTSADIEFHNVFLHNCGNVFIPMLLGPIAEELYDGRYQTSSVEVVRLHAQENHRKILDAVISGDPEACKQAVDSHINQTTNDLLREVIVGDSFALPPTALNAQKR
jgi:GntR family transcriptional repressor for pyruvate dehydrogenase complex